MQQVSSSTLFLILSACAAIFICLTSLDLSDVVGSHFTATGTANGFMPRAAYVHLMLASGVGLPLLMVLFQNLLLSRVNLRLNLPNREYWLAPARRAQTIEFLRQHFARFGSMLVVFLCYVHWLVVRANASFPPRLSSFWFIAGLIAFLVATLVWSKRLFDRFRVV